MRISFFCQEIQSIFAKEKMMSTNEIVEEIVHFFIQWILVETNRSYFE